MRRIKMESLSQKIFENDSKKKENGTSEKTMESLYLLTYKNFQKSCLSSPKKSDRECMVGLPCLF